MKSQALKALIIGGLIVALMIPILMVKILVEERKDRRNEAISQIERSWGGKTEIKGLLLEGDRTEIIPEYQSITCDMKTEVRKRGIFEIPLYSCTVTIKAQFPEGIAPTVKKDLMLAVNHTGEVKTVSAVWGNDQIGKTSGERSANSPYYRIAKWTSIDHRKSRTCTAVITLRGVQSFEITRQSSKTDIVIKSDWKKPNFTGDDLPSKRTITSDGFYAEWNIENAQPAGKSSPCEGTFGVSLFVPVDVYVLTDRVLKYSFLFIFLTFGLFFVFETLGKFRVHPFQYLLIGGALCIFYLLLLSLSEQVSFGIAYLFAAAAVVSLVVSYCRAILRENKRPAIIGVFMAILYLFLYLLLQLEEYSLFAGTIGLFIMIAGTMYLTRNIDWYNPSESLKKKESASAGKK